MTTPVYVCPRRTPAQLFDQDFDGERQLRLIAYAAAPRQGPVACELRAGQLAAAWKEAGRSFLCIGDAASTLLHSVRQRAGHMLAELAADQAPHWPRWNTLVLLTPDLPAGAFAANADAFSEAAFVLRCFERIVVLHCPQDRIIAGNLGRGGPAADSDSRVSAVDLSALVECRDDSAYGALCSCEALSLILRLLQGAPLPAALPVRPRPATA